MKQLIAVFITIITFHTIQAQQKTLIRSDHYVSGFGALTIENGSLNGDYIGWIGAGGGIIVDDFFVGGFGTGTTKPDFISMNGDQADLSLAYGGLWLGYTWKGDNLIHPYIDTKLGWGAAIIEESDAFNGDEIVDPILAINPNIGVEVNIAKYVRALASFGYRGVNGIDKIVGVENEDVSGFIGGITLRVGGFEKKKNTELTFNW